MEGYVNPLNESKIQEANQNNDHALNQIDNEK